MAEGFARLDRELAARGLTASALVGVHLRSQAPVDLGAFDDFNVRYHALLAERGVLEDAVNPVARTNVVPVHAPPAEPVIHTAFVVRAAAGAGGTDFVVAGCGEIIGGLAPENIVARGDLSPAGLTRKASAVLAEIGDRVRRLGVDASVAATVNVYTSHEVTGLPDLLVDGLPVVARSGFVRWLTSPPVVEVEFEMDCHRVSAWQAIP